MGLRVEAAVYLCLSSLCWNPSPHARAWCLPGGGPLVRDMVNAQELKDWLDGGCIYIYSDSNSGLTVAFSS